MKKINYIIMITLLVFIELFSLLYFFIYDNLGLYFNNPIVPIAIFALAVFIAYFIFCKKSIVSNIGEIKIEKIIIVTISIITILKIFTLIPIISLKSKIIEPMKEIDNNYMSYSSFDELRKVANITITNIDDSSTPINIPYLGYIRGTDYFKNFFLASPIINGEINYNNSYSDFVKSVKKSNAIYGEEWINAATSTIEEIQKNTLFLPMFSIIYEILVISVPIIIRKKS